MNARHCPRYRKGILGAWLVIAIGLLGAASAQQTPLDPLTVPKYVEPLPMPLRIDVTANTPLNPLQLSMHEFQQKLLPNNFYTNLAAPYNAGTYLWCYKAAGWPQTFPGPTLEARVGTATAIDYDNQIVGPNGGVPVLQQWIPIDQTIHWADPLGTGPSMLPYVGPVPVVPHLHGGEVPSAFDGGPNNWFTPGEALTGPTFPGTGYIYPNTQQPTTLWYHDHLMGGTRINVYAGLAGFYLLRDWTQEKRNLPGGPLDTPRDQYGNVYEREIVVQDRMFDTNGQLFFPHVGLNPEHPLWVPEYFGDNIMVNGKTWPYLNVEPRRYRFRFLDGSNARFYDMRLWNLVSGAPGPAFWQIGTDGGQLDRPVMLNDPAAVSPPGLKFAPGERCDIVIDFSGYAGQTLTMVNVAPAPYPGGDLPDPNTTGQIMQFRVGTTVTGGRDPSLVMSPLTVLRSRLIERLTPTVTTKTRALTLNEIEGAGGPLVMYVNNSMYDMAITEKPLVGDTEVWEIINLTMDTHPIHLHLVEFQLLSRQAFDLASYLNVYGTPEPGMGPPLPYEQVNAATGFKRGGNPDVTPFLLGPQTAPDPNERGWKDTFRMNTGEVTRVIVRFAPQNALQKAQAQGATLAPGVNLFDFEPWVPMGQVDSFGYPGGPGYVWHCHIVDHEDNEMMRPYLISGPPAPAIKFHDLIGSGAPPIADALTITSGNPSRGATSFRVGLANPTDVDLSIFDVAGRQVATVAGGPLAAGSYHFTWNPAERRDLGSGVYLARLRAGTTEQKVRFMVVR